ncbi:MAG: tetratricopeptide repeat-containing sensor histidine kinase [Bacteroidales bacterium]
MPFSFKQIALWLIISLLSLLSNTAHAQKNIKAYKDSSLLAYKKAKHDTTKVIALTNLVEGLAKNTTVQDTALRLGKIALETARQSMNVRAEMRALYALGYVYAQKSQDTIAFAYWNQCISLGQNVSFPDIMAKVYYYYGQSYFSLGAYNRAEQIFSKGLSYCDTTTNKDIHIKLLLEYGIVNYMRFKYASALDAYFKAVSLAGNEQKYADTKAKVFTNIGILYQNLDDYRSTRKYYCQALEIFEKNHDNGNMSNLLVNFGAIYSAMGNDSLALEYNQKALKFAKLSQEPIHIANAYNEMATLYKERFCNDSLAFFLYFQELEQRKKSGDTYYEASCLTYIAQLFDNLGNYSKAEQYYKESLNKSMGIGADDQTIYTLAQMAVSYKRQKRFPEAIDFALQTLKIAENNPDFRLEARTVATTLADIYREKGEVENFLRYNKIENDAKEAEHEHLLNKLQIVYEIDRKNKEQIDLLNQENFLQHEEIKQQQQKMWFLLIGFGLLFLVGAVILKNNRIRKESNLQLAQKNTELEELNRIKDRMFFLISHDLRGPLCSLRGGLSLIEAKILTDEQQKKLSSGLIQKFNEASNLMDNVLYWATIQLGELSRTPEAFSLKTVIDECINEAEGFAIKKGVIIDYQIDETLVAEADRHLLTLALKNLIGNAIKYSNPNQKIEILTQQGEKFHTILIKDKGKGIAAKELRNLFEFHVAPSIGTAGEKGVGIGLMLAKQMVETNGGGIRVESIENEGSTFSFTIPAQIDRTKEVIAFKEKYQVSSKN